VRDWFSPSTQALEAELAELTSAIEAAPRIAASWLRRGEISAQLGRHDLAASDFRRALALAEDQMRVQPWGIVAQALRDRALRGLKSAQAAASATIVGSER
jgi:predicted TPR repeat methyltransferase